MDEVLILLTIYEHIILYKQMVMG